jgi:hypothetical protein
VASAALGRSQEAEDFGVGVRQELIKLCSVVGRHGYATTSDASKVNRQCRRHAVASIAVLSWDDLTQMPGIGIKKAKTLVEMLSAASS